MTRLTDAQLLLRRTREFTAEERAVIRERHYGWELASCSDLAAIFNTTPQAIAAICRTVPAQSHTRAPVNEQMGERL